MTPTEDQMLRWIFDDGKWFRFPKAFLSSMKPSDAVLMAYLINHVVRGLANSDGWFKCGRKKLQFMMGLSETQQFRALDRLKEKGFIEVGIGDRHSSRVIRLNLAKVWECFGHYGGAEPEEGRCVTATTTLRKGNLLITKVQCAARVKKPIETVETSENNGVEESFEKKASRKLAEIIEKEYKVTKDTRNWPKVFAAMQRWDKISSTRIKEAIKGYGKIIGDMIARPPIIEDAQNFRRKFISLEEAIKRGQIKSPEIVKINLDEDAQEALRKIETSDLTWPHGSKQTLPQLVAASMAGAKAFCERRAALVAIWRENKLDERRALINFDGNLGAYVLCSDTGGLPRFVTKWAEHVNAIIQAWNDWRGNMPYFHFTATHKDFRKMIIEAGTPDAHLLVDEYLRRMNRQ